MQNMKLILMKTLLMTLTILISTACQEEYIEIDEPDKTKTISADDTIAELIYKVVLKDGSFDNIIDRCSEISIKFPYSIMIDEQLYPINSKGDIDRIMLDYFHLRDDIEINYPVTISYSDYFETLLHNEDELERIQEQYNANLNDADIECIDFLYPITLTLYNTEFQKNEVIVANNDYDIYRIFSKIYNLIVEFDFPISLKTLNGATIIITDNDELESEINNFIASCDEDDNVDFDDEDFPYEEIVTDQVWKVSFYSDTTNETSSFSSYIFNFLSDYTVQANTGNEIIYGTWELQSDDITTLEIDFDTDESPLVWLNQSWMIKNSNSSLIEMEAESDFEGFTMKLNLIKAEK